MNDARWTPELSDTQGRHWLLSLDLSENHTLTVLCDQQIVHTVDKGQLMEILREREASEAADAIATLALPDVVVPADIHGAMRETVRAWVVRNQRELVGT